VITVVVFDVNAVLMGAVVVDTDDPHSIANKIDPSSGSDADAHFSYEIDGFPHSAMAWYIS
jgi:hypothetical protein